MMRESVRRLCSAFTGSKPSPMAISGTRNDGSATSASWLLRVNSRRKRNGSSAVTSLICSTAPRTTMTATPTTRTTSTTTRMLVKWSAISFSVTTPKPCKAEPSRRMALSFMGLEVPRVDGFEARLLDRKAQQPAAGRNRRGRCFRADVAIGPQPHAIVADMLDLADARNGGEPLRQTEAFRFDLDVEAAAEHLASQRRNRADQPDAALAEQRHAVATALPAVGQARRPQKGDALLVDVAG